MKDVKDRDGQFQDIFLNMTKKRAENLSVFGVFCTFAEDSNDAAD